MDATALILSRIQFAFTISFHIIFSRLWKLYGKYCIRKGKV